MTRTLPREEQMAEAISSPKDLDRMRNERRERLVDLLDFASEWQEHVAKSFADSEHQKLAPKVMKDRLEETRDRYASLRHKLEESDFPAHVWSEILEIIVDGLLRAEPECGGSIDLFEDLLIRIERIRRLVRDTLDDHIFQYGHDQKSVVQMINKRLDEIPLADRARLLGISPKQYGRWGESLSAPNEKLVAVATLVAILNRSWNQRGVVKWFDRSRPELDDRTPLECMGDPDFDPQALVELARHGLSQRAS